MMTSVVAGSASLAHLNAHVRRDQLPCVQTRSLQLISSTGSVFTGGSSFTSFSDRRISYKSHLSRRNVDLFHVRAAQVTLEKTYVMVKPDGVQRGLVGEIISRFERKGFVLKGLKLFQCPKELAEVHYKDLKEKPFFPRLVKYITSGPVVCMAWEGPGVVASARKLIGVTNPLQAEPGTIRGDLAVEVGLNIVHGSDSPENGEREVALWFKDGELCDWTQTMTPWLRGS
eukprot:c18929_g1_i1 orf=492-1178(-)